MSPVGIFFVIAGFVVLFVPEVIQAVVGSILLLIGANILLVGWAMRKKGEQESFRFGSYEIFRNKK